MTEPSDTRAGTRVFGWPVPTVLVAASFALGPPGKGRTFLDDLSHTEWAAASALAALLVSALIESRRRRRSGTPECFGPLRLSVVAPLVVAVAVLIWTSYQLTDSGLIHFVVAATGTMAFAEVRQQSKWTVHGWLSDRGTTFSSWLLGSATRLACYVTTWVVLGLAVDAANVRAGTWLRVFVSVAAAFTVADRLAHRRSLAAHDRSESVQGARLPHSVERQGI